MTKTIQGEEEETMNTNRIVRLPEVLELTGLSRSTLYRAVERGDFPRQVKIVRRRAVGWLFRDIKEWLESRREVGSSAKG